MSRGHLRVPCLVVLLLTGASAVWAQRGEDFVEPEPGWESVGDFNGSAGAGLLRLIHEQIRERESDGALYQDLGDVSLGLSASLGDDGRIYWDNSFYRRVLPFHDEIPPGETIGPDDYSRYIDIKTIVSRGRLNYDYLPEVVGDTGIGIRVEGGTSLTLAHVTDPLHLGDRPLEAVLEEQRSSSISDLLQEDATVEGRPIGDPSLIRLGAEGVARFAQWIADVVGNKTVDTERGAIFYEGYADPITQIIDLGVPVHSELFREGGPLGVGDRVRHVTFVGLVPVGATLRRYGLWISYQRFYRFLRETTIFKRAENEIIVVVRNSVATGNEYLPLKIRPEVRVLGILRLGYTFFEQIIDRAKTTSWETAYRVDLSDPRGLEAFEQLLGEGTKATFRPLASTAEKGIGAEILNTQVQRGRQNTSLRRAQFFSLINKRDSRIASDQLIDLGDFTIEQVARTKSTRYRKSIGRDRRWDKLFAVTAQSDISVDDELETEERPESWGGAVTLVSGLRDDYADPETIGRAAALIRTVNPAVDWTGMLEEMTADSSRPDSRMVINSLLSLDGSHVEKLAAVDADRLWQELADLLLGSQHREVWSTPERRLAWRKNPRREAARIVDRPPTSFVVTSTRKTPKRYDVLETFRFARRVAKRFHRLQQVMKEGSCVSCIADAFDKWRDVAAMHALFARLSHDPSLPEPGYHYEIFTDAMLRPITLTNGIRYSFPSEWDVTADLLSSQPMASLDSTSPTDVETLQGELDKRRWDWEGSRSLVEASASRLNAGMLLANTDARSNGPCWQLRLFADHSFDATLRLRIDLREVTGKPIDADHPIDLDFFDLGSPTVVVQTPFMVSRYYYDIPIDEERAVREGGSYTLLLRVLNPDGIPVSEEQQLSFTVPVGISARMPEHCRPPGASVASAHGR